MLISRNLLALLQPAITNITSEQLAEAFIKVGVEVEAVYAHQPIKEIYFGLVKSCQKHPKSQKLSLCEVELSTGVTKTIVCGAANVRTGLKVVVVQPGAVLPNGLAIQPREVLGQLSDGMICAYDEIRGIDKTILSNGNDDEGIIELDADFNYQQPFNPSVLGLDDWVFDLSLPSNRPDLHCAFGLVVEISQKLNLAFKIPSYEELWSKVNDLARTATLKVVNNQKTNDAAFFVEINQIAIQKSDWNLKSLMLNNNLGSINNLVDLGNLLVLLFQQPVHFHDVEKIRDKTLKIDYATNQTFTDLNQKNYQLSQDEIVILDGADQVLALGGMIGSDVTKISDTTTTSYLELINFQALPILKANLKYQINSLSTISNSSQKSNYLSLLALNFIIQKLSANYDLKLAYAVAKKPEPRIIQFNQIWLEEFIGHQFKSEMIIDQLIKLGFTQQNDHLIVPTWRLDLHDFNDLAEEITNIIGINEIAFTPPVLVPQNKLDLVQFENWNQIRQYWLHKNFFEAKTYNLQKRNDVEKFNFMHTPIYADLKNYNNINRTTLRTHSLRELLEVALINLSKQNRPVSWFELANVFADDSSRLGLSVLAIPDVISFPMNQTKLSHDLYDLKTYLSESLNLCHQQINFKGIDADKYLTEVFVPENTNCIVDGNDQILGYVGQLNYGFLKNQKWNLKQVCYGAFVWVDRGVPLKRTAPVLSEYPSSFRDFSFSLSLDAHLKLGDLIQQIYEITNVVEVNLIDKYVDEKTENNYLLTVRLNNLSKTLDSQEIDTAFNDIVAIFTNNNIKLR
ncbi:phenylalanyl-tRNA synthetase beta chain [Mycoplasmoides fastidiosum]|uniref:Phenylalanine--tRNA ligase beta subunit n=1 Tax=Mycoplasmoides fastidiosum TaxID=92758 RepID=A0ABU0LYX2_9BACT|nr:phenylalanine--tRNA ligase subunit beta [Mycoplasmoides fastidiosum]MDQ0513872.1 phenylalanyl-tRNA synthetase beta chain [Mycoplasmoides fastidiosum]UUD37714.1 phenylalanine--tRNA ligase subunit beta [Mycoplasmoides fastidiosum]